MKKITTFTLLNRKSLLFFFYSVFFSFKSLAFLCGAPTVNGTGTITPSAAWQTVICSSGAVRYIELQRLLVIRIHLQRLQQLVEYVRLTNSLVCKILTVLRQMESTILRM